jgi:crotonobetainyl-CoA:carnitine CoA-transferase CaiB-like acyl-CoA transferase
MGADLSIQAISGILDLTGEPIALSCWFSGDRFPGSLNAFGAICAALVRRKERKGQLHRYRYG